MLKVSKKITVRISTCGCKTCLDEMDNYVKEMKKMIDKNLTLRDRVEAVTKLCNTVKSTNSIPYEDYLKKINARNKPTP